MIPLLASDVAGQIWDGGGANSNWTTGNNWNPDGAPVNNGTADVIFGGSTSTSPFLDVNYDVNSISFDHAAGAFSLEGPSTLTIRGGGITSSGFFNQTINNNIVLGANQSWNVTDSGLVLTVNGDVSGTGSLTKQGNGIVRLTGNNNYTGETVVEAGFLVLHADASLPTGGALTMSNGVLDINGTNQTVSSLSGSSGVILFRGGSLTVDTSESTTYTGLFLFHGTFIKDGTGTLNLDSATSLSANTFINGGRLNVNGSTGANTFVTSGGTLGGNGTISASVTNSGTVAPGNSIGTLTVAGQYTNEADGVLQIEINDAGTTAGVNNDLLAAGDATLHGGTVNVLAEPGTYTDGTTYRFLSSTTPIQGVFDGINNDLSDFTTTLGYDFFGGLHWAFFTLEAVAIDYPSFAQTQNQFAVATYLDGVAPGATGDLQVVFDGLNTLTGNPPAMRGAFDALSPQVDPTLTAIGLQNTTLVLQQLAGQLRTGRLGAGGGYAAVGPGAAQPSAPIALVSYNQDGLPQTTFASPRSCDCCRGWTFGYGLGGSAKGDGNASGLSYGMGGTLLGVERWLDRGRLGFFGGYQGTGLRLTGLAQTGNINGGMLGTYLYNNDDFGYYMLIGGLQFNGFNTRRFVQFDGINRIANANFSGWLGYSYFERGVTFAAGPTTLQPYAALQYIYLRQNSYTETGADALNLAVSGIDANSLRSLVGGRLQYNPNAGSGQRLFPELRALWLHEFLATDAVVNSFFAPIGGGSFAVQGLNLGRDWAIVGGGLRYELPSGWQLFANYDAQVNTQQVFHVGSGGAEYTW